MDLPVYGWSESIYIFIFTTQSLQQLMKEMKNKSPLSMQTDMLPLICRVSDMFR